VSYRTAAAIWFGLELACLVASVHLLARAVGVPLSASATLGLALVLPLWYPVLIELTWGQVQLPMLALLAGAWLGLRSGRSRLAGVLVGLAVLLKPFVLPLLLWFLLRRNWHALAAASLVISGGYLLAGAVLGLPAVSSYVTEVLPAVSAFYRSAWGNFSVSSLAWRLFQGTEDSGIIIAPPLIPSLSAARVGAIVLPLLLLALVSLAVQLRGDLDVAWSLLVIASILVSPLAWSYYLVLAAIPAAHVIAWLGRNHLPSAETNRALVVAILLLLPWLELATMLALAVVTARRTLTLPFALAQLPLMPAVGLGALAWLVARLGGPGADAAPAVGHA
jgi:hypothetical protein